MTKKIYEIDGSKSATLEEFAEHFSTELQLETQWRGNLDAFNDILRGGFGTPAEGFVLVWRNSAASKEGLAYSETVKWLDERMRNCHPTNVETFRQLLTLAKQGRGETLFDMIVEIITAPEHSDIVLRRNDYAPISAWSRLVGE